MKNRFCLSHPRSIIRFGLSASLLITVVGVLIAAPIDQAAMSMFKDAQAAFKGGDATKAIELLEGALRKEPDNAMYRYALGLVLHKSGKSLQAKESFEIVSRSRPSKEKGDEYNAKLKEYKTKIKDMQEELGKAGDASFQQFLQNKDSPQKTKLAFTLYSAFRLNPPLRYKNFDQLNTAIQIYEGALKGKEGMKAPMLQLAFLYEISNKKDKAAELYMRALDYVENDPNEEFVITHKFDYLNRSNKEKLLDTIEAGEFTQKDIEDMLGSKAGKVSDADRKKIQDLVDNAKRKLESATSEEERESVLEEIKTTIIEKHKSGELGVNDELKKKLEKEGKTLEQYLQEQGL